MTEADRTKETIICKACGYDGDIGTYNPCFSVYNDIRCPKCGSTNNEHNAEYARRISAAMRAQETSNG